MWTPIPLADFLQDFEAPWDALNERLYRGHPLFDSRFVFSMIRHFPSPGLRAYALGSLAQPRALVVVEPYRFAYWRGLQRSQAEALPVLIEKRDVPQLSSLMRALSPWTQFIDFLRQDPNFSPWGASSPSTPAVIQSHARTASISLAGSFDSYWGSRPKRLRENIARSIRKATAEVGEISLRVVEDPSAIESAVRDFGEMEIRSWKAEGGTAIGPDNPQGLFYQDVFRQFAVTGQAVSYELMAGRTVIARQLALANPDICITLKTTYAEESASLSPGRLLDYEMLRHEFGQQRYRSIELYTKADSLQLQWATGTRTINHVTCFRSHLAGRIYRLMAGRQRDDKAA